MNALYQSFLKSFDPRTFEVEMESFFADILRGLVVDGVKVLPGHRELPRLYADAGQEAGEAEWDAPGSGSVNYHGDSIVVFAQESWRENYQEVTTLAVTVRTVSSGLEPLTRHESRCALVRAFFSEEQLAEATSPVSGQTTSKALIDAATAAAGVQVQSVERVDRSRRDFDGERLAWVFTEMVQVRGNLVGS